MMMMMMIKIIIIIIIIILILVNGLTWSANCVISTGTAANQVTTFAITDTNLYVPVVA